MHETSCQSRFDARYWMLGAGALGRPRGISIWGGRREEGSGWGTHVYLWRIHFDIWQNQYNYVKFKNKIKLKKKKERKRMEQTSTLPGYSLIFLISWLQSPSAVILEPPKIKSDTVSTVSPSICHEVMGPHAMVLVF